MGYQSRKRGYKSRRERFDYTVRNTRIIFIFLSLGMAVWVFKNRLDWWAWLKTYFY
ncbi:MAG: hypothetical protein KDD02_19495 [Phaeodactylibacter sp.]|nr:hypothetical protein [Saprospiraceae bacterium]MCB0555741.1 hypothetical protein [Phaeodactylibacter sp.]MCB0615377.1 hypothetical protein [Phaeodactylibacter sp.]MCB9302029.1 hypothetical protein [Lewinellaceae bacterium]